MALNFVSEGQGYLAFVSTTQLKLSRWNGQYIPQYIGGVISVSVLPAAGITIANTGLAANTNHYVYLYDNAGTPTLEVSTPGYVEDTTYGFKVKSGDNSRTLVGFARTGAGTPGVFQAQGLGTLSWFNRRAVKVENKSTTYGTVTGSFPAGVEVNSAFRQNFVSWADDRPLAYINGSAGPQGGSDNVIALARDTTVLEQEYHGTGTAVFGHFSITSSVNGAETDHYITIFAGSSSTIFVNGNQTANQGTTATVAVVVQG